MLRPYHSTYIKFQEPLVNETWILLSWNSRPSRISLNSFFFQHYLPLSPSTVASVLIYCYLYSPVSGFGGGLFFCQPHALLSLHFPFLLSKKRSPSPLQDTWLFSPPVLLSTPHPGHVLSLKLCGLFS